MHFSTGSNPFAEGLSKRTSLKPEKVEQLLVIKENKQRIEEFLSKKDYAVDTNLSHNSFNTIELELDSVVPRDEETDSVNTSSGKEQVSSDDLDE